MDLTSPLKNHRSKSLARLIQADQNTDPDTISTDALIHNFDALGLRGEGGHGPSVGDDEVDPFLDTTASYLAFGGNRNYNVSQTRMEIQNNEPITPIKRSVSQSSLRPLPSAGSFGRRRSSGSLHDPLETPPSPYLDIDYLQTLLLLLPNQQHYSDFKGILQQYLTILHEHDMNPALDKFIITIHNQLKSRSHNKLDKIIDIFINEPSNLAMKLSNHIYFKNRAIQKSTLQNWIIKSRKNHELKQSWKIWMIYLKKKYITQWIYKHQVVKEDLIANADMFYQIRRLMKVWDVWKTNHQRNKDFAQIANYQIQSKFFNNWKEQIELDYDQAEWAYQQKLIQSSLKKWKLETTSKITTSKSKISNFFQKWQNKQLEIKQLEQDGEQLERVFHAGFFFAKWKAKSQVTLNKTQELEQIFANLLKSKYFTNWQNVLYYIDIEKQVLEKRKHLLLEFALNEWKQRLSHKQMLESFTRESDKVITSKLLSRWRRQLTLKNKVDQVRKQTRLRSSMTLWKLLTNKKVFERLRDANIQSSVFKDWKKKAYFSSASKSYDLLVKQRYWEKLKAKKSELDNTLIIGNEAYEAYSKIIYFNNWKYQINHNKDLKTKADNFNQGVHFKKIKYKADKLNKLKDQADDFYNAKLSKSILREAFSNWQKSFEYKLEEQLKSQMESFQKMKANLEIKSFFNNWKDQYQSYRTQEQIFKEEFQNGLILKPVFNQWIEKYNDIRDMEEKANEMNNLNLVSSGFTKLQLGYLRIQDLSLNLSRFEENSQVKLILKYLNFWSLKSFKLKRDNDNIESFQRRWNRAHCRAILLLWKGKTWERQEQLKLKLNISQMDIDDETDDDYSPLKPKSVFNSSNLISAETPKRSKSIFNIAKNNQTPNNVFNQSSIGIPGSERIKRQRMTALKNHYSQIKYAIPSPLKSEVKRPIGMSTIKKLNFNKNEEDNEFDEPILRHNEMPFKGEHEGEYYLADESMEYENPISSPVISHQKINKTFLERFNSSKSNRSSSASDNLFKNPF